MAGGMDIETVVTASLGNATHLIAADREAIVVDPPRDAWRIAAVAADRGWRLTHVLETHVHNDYLSGALELRASHGVEILAPARGGYTFDHRPMDEGDALDLNGLRIVARATPGHTPGHVSFYYAPERALFAGDALAVIGDRVRFMARPVTPDLAAARASMRRWSMRASARRG